MVGRTIKVAIADDHPVYLLGLRALLEPEKDLIVVGDACNGVEAMLLIERFDPDILIVDIEMPVMGGLDVLTEIAKKKLRTQVIVLLAASTRDKAVRAVRAGARGVLFKEQEPALLAKSIRKVNAGEVWVDNPILSEALESLVKKPPAADGSQKEHGGLSSRELEVVRCVSMGLRNKEVAAKLGVSEATVKNHLTSVYSKLGVSDRLELILYAIHNKMIAL